MKQDEKKTVVIFRVWKSGSGKGEVIALFPGVDFDGCGLYCNSFEHVGQHGAATYTDVISKSSPATPKQYSSVKRELEKGYGYKLSVRKRYTPAK